MIQIKPPVIYVDEPKGMFKFIDHVRSTKECALDTETTGLNRWKDHILVWSACPDLETRYCFSRDMLALYDMDLAHDPEISWYFTNQTFDFCMFNNSGVSPPDGPSYCTLAMDWLYDENNRGFHGLKETAKKYLGLSMTEFKEQFKKKQKETYQDAFLRVLHDDFDSAIDYASTDAWATFRVFKYLQEELKKQTTRAGLNLWDHFESIEMPFTRVLYNMIRRGIMVDEGYLSGLAPKMEKDLLLMEKAICKIAGKEINIRSPKQLQWLIYDQLKIPPGKKTKGGSLSTDEETLEKLAGEGIEACSRIMEHRSLSKTHGTYVVGLSKWVDPNLRIHTTLTQHVAVTGRLSSVEPNLMNIPRPDNDKYKLREAFIPKEGYTLICLDFKQIEMRIIAHMSQDPQMIGVINRGWDIHAGTACVMFGYDYDTLLAALKKKKKDQILTDDEEVMCFGRFAAKTIGFGQPESRPN